MTDDSKTETAKSPSPDTSDELDQLRKERDEYYDLLLRKTADLDNYRKRTERDRATLEHAAAADLILELLPVVDDLERALSADSESSPSTAYRAGVELIHKQLLNLLEKRGVAPVEAMGANFDPHYHQAVQMVAAGESKEGEVIEEVRRGYTLSGRLLRPSMVKVAKA